MFAVRRLPSLHRLLSVNTRAFATVVTAEPASSVPLEAEATAEVVKSQGRRRRKIPPKRPQISLDNPRSWNRPLKTGVVPAYDLALQLLHRDSETLQAEVKLLRDQISEKEKEYATLQENIATLPEAEQESKLKEMEALDQQLEAMMKKANIIEVQSEVNLPAVRWTVNNAMADMSKVSHRHLVEQKWRKDGDLDLLMERLYQMNVVPDVLPEIRPTVDLHIVARTTPSDFLEKKKVQMQVEAGAFLRPKQTLTPLKLRANVFHTDERLYTMILVDPDVPNPQDGTYSTFLHWMKPNIPLSATSSNRLTGLNDHTTYIPPHPQRGTPYHRYVCLLLPQPPISKYSLNTAARATGPTSQHLDIPIVPEDERLGFDVREFTQKWGLEAASGGGAHMFRQVWDQDVSKIYQDNLKQDEPRYSRPPKFNVYEQLKGRKKYLL